MTSLSRSLVTLGLLTALHGGLEAEPDKKPTNQTSAASEIALGIKERGQGRLKEAVAAFDRAVKRNPNDPQAYNWRGVAKFEANEPAEALMDFNRAISLNPKFTEAFTNRGALSKSRGNLDLAIMDLTEAIRLNPSYIWAHHLRADAFMAKRLISLAINDYTRALELTPTDGMLLKKRGNAYCEDKQYQRAFEDYTKSISSQPGDVRVLLSRAAVLKLLNRGAEAEADYRQVLAADATNVEAKTGLEQLTGTPKKVKSDAYLKASTAYTDGKYHQSLDILNAVLQHDPGNASALNLRGLVYLSLKEPTKAKVEFDDALTHEPRLRAAYVNRGETHLRLKDHEAAVRDFSEAINISGKQDDTYRRRARALAHLGRKDEAIADYTTCLRINPKSDVALLARGTLYGEAKKWKESITDLLAAVRISPKKEAVWDALEEVSKSLVNEPSSESEDLQRQLSSILDKGRGADHIQSLEVAYNFAESLRENGKYREAVPLYERALAGLKGRLGDNHVDTAIALNNLAFCLARADDVSRAESLTESALPILERKLGAKHHVVAAVRENLGNIITEQGRHADAEPHFRRAEAIFSATPGREAQAARALASLASCLHAQKNGHEAEQAYRRAIAVYGNGSENKWGVSAAFFGLAEVLTESGRKEEAEASAQRALQIRLSPEYTNTTEAALSCYQVAVHLHRKSQYTEESELLRKGLSILSTNAAESLDGYGYMLVQLATSLVKQGKISEAEELLHPMLRWESKRQQGDSIRDVSLLEVCRNVLRAKGMSELQLEQELLEQMRQHAPSDSFWIANQWNTAGVAHFKQADYGAAQRCYNQALAIYGKRETGAARSAVVRVNLGAMLRDQGQLQEAKTALSEALIVLSKSEDQPTVLMRARCRYHLATVYERTQQGDLAQKEIRQSLHEYETLSPKKSVPAEHLKQAQELLERLLKSPETKV